MELRTQMIAAILRLRSQPHFAQDDGKRRARVSYPLYQALRLVIPRALGKSTDPSRWSAQQTCESTGRGADQAFLPCLPSTHWNISVP